ncbi:MAG: dTMP kinase [Pseudohongiellaceae bacterium]
MKGKFITIEGVEGVGKSTNIETVKAYLAQNKIKFVVSREPGGTLISEKIRDLLLEKHEEDLTELSELLLVFAARSQHIETFIKPHLENGTWVLCDRFTDATYAYQGGGRGLSRESISELENLVQKNLRPDLTVILDLDPKIGLERAKKRGELDRFEIEKLSFFEKVRDAYLEIARRDGQRCRVIDASQPLVQVGENITQVMTQFLADLT